MELLPQGQQNTTEVEWADQQKINRFLSLISQKDELVAKLEGLKTEKEYIDDLALEIELLDEDEKIQYKIGEIFVFLKVEDAVKRIEKENEELETKILSMESEIESIDEQLLTYKTQLYAKFGKNINLER